MSDTDSVTQTPPEVSIEEQRRTAELDGKLQRAADRVRATAPTRTVNVVAGVEEQDGECACGAAAKRFRLILRPEDAATKPFTQQRCTACIARADAEQAEQERVARIEANRAKAREMLAVPPLYANATLEGFQFTGDEGNQARQRSVLARAAEYIAQWPDVPLLSIFVGPPGTGKGHVAWSIERARVEQRAAMCRFTVLPDLIRDLRENWGPRRDDESDGTSEARRLAKYREADLLVIDEVSKHAFYGLPYRHLYDVIAWREVQMRPTIITTNETGAELAEYLGIALTSRASASGDVWDFGAVDYRPLKRRTPRAS